MQRAYTIRMLEKRFSLILLSRQYRYFYVADKMPTDTVLPKVLNQKALTRQQQNYTARF